jgi:S-layer protein
LNSFTGTDGNDTFNAGNATGTAAGQTLTVGDTLVGGAGTDTLNATIGAASTYALSNVSQIEKVNATFTAAGTVSLLGSSGVTELNSNGSTAAATFTNIGSTGVVLGLKNTDQAATYTFTTAAVSGGADKATLVVSNAAQATTVATTIAGVEELTIRADADSTIGLLTAAAATSIVATGAGALTIVDDLSVATSFDASASTGGVDVDFDLAVTAIGGAGNDVFTSNPAADTVVSFTGGAGNDTFVFDATGVLTTADTVAGGDGVDTLQVATSANLTGYSIPATATISGIEVLSFDAALGAALTTANIQAGIDRVNLAAGAGGQTITMEAGSKTIAFSAAAAAATVVADTGSAITDSLTLLNDSAATDVYDGRDLTVTGYETVTVNSSTTTTREWWSY